MIVVVIVIVVWVISIYTWCGVFPNVDCRWLYTIHGLYREKFFHRTEQKVSMNDRMYLKRDSCIIIYRSFFFSFHSLLLSPPFSTLSSSRIHLTTTLFHSLYRHNNNNHVIYKEIHSFLVWWCCILCGSYLCTSTRSYKGAIANYERKCQHGHAWHHGQDCSY